MPQGNFTSRKPTEESVIGHKIAIADKNWQTYPKEPKWCRKHPTAKAIWNVNRVGFCRECKDAAYRAAGSAKGI